MSILRFLVALASLVGVVRTDQAGVNSGDFIEICNFVHLLESPPTQPEIKRQDKKIDVVSTAVIELRRISILNASTADDATFKQLQEDEEYEKAKSNPIVEQMGEQSWDSLRKQWKEQNTGRSPLREIRRPDNPQLRQRLHRSIGKLYAKALEITQEIKQVDDALKENLMEARKNMLSAVYGERTVQPFFNKNQDGGKSPGGAVDVGTLKATADSVGPGADSYAKACGGSGSSKEMIGISILVDAVCLCTKETPSTETYCGSGINGFNGVSGVSGSGYDTPAELALMANHLKTKCDAKFKSKERPTPSPQTLHEIIARLRARLGQNAVQHSNQASGNHLDGAQFILGAYTVGSGAVACEGTNDPSGGTGRGKCINYKNILEAGEEIPWVKNIRAAAKYLKEVEGNFSLEIALLLNLQSLCETAELYYEHSEDESLSHQMPTPEGNYQNGTTNGEAKLAQVEKQVTGSGSAAKNRRGCATTVASLLALVG